MKQFSIECRREKLKQLRWQITTGIANAIRFLFEHFTGYSVHQFVQVCSLFLELINSANYFKL